MSGRKKTREPKEENVTLGPTVREGEYVFGVAHIFASFNDTFIRADVHQDLGAHFGSPIPDSQSRCLHCGIGSPVVYDQYGASAFCSASAESFILATLYHFKLEVSTFWK
ncbi:hypothetical protein ABZP36_008109 [Zizania latifolia]